MSKTNLTAQVILLLVILATALADQCKWKSLAGANYDLQPLTVTDQRKFSYHIIDGDLPCTAAHEPTYSYAWNFCAYVTAASEPTNQNGGGNICLESQRGAAIQYLNRTSDGYHECNVIGRYDSSNENSEWSLLDASDPSKGVSMKYPSGERCPSGVLRSATIDVQVCAGVRVCVCLCMFMHVHVRVRPKVYVCL